MIPKKIHYVWVGDQNIPKNLKKCMKSWKNKLSDYEIKEWSEKNFDVKKHPFVYAAYKARKWAFVSDYIRAYALYNEGGIYLDTDNIVLTELDDLLVHKAFVGFEEPEYPFTACFGSVKGHALPKAIIDYYDNLSFSYNKDNPFINVNTKSVSKILIDKFDCQIGDKEQDLKTGIHVYKSNVLCHPSIDSKVIHVFTGTWLDGKSKLVKKISQFLKINIKSPIHAEIYRKLFSSRKGNM